jgi:zinc transport system substrate-binding protein
MVELSKSRAYFTLGLEFEKAWLYKFASLAKNVRIVPVDTLVVKTMLDSADVAPSREDKGESGLDPHIWLSPELVKQQAETICRALRELDPGHDSAYAANLQAFLREVVSLQDSIHSVFKPDSLNAQARPFLVFHPSWGYFAHEFKLRQIAIEVEGKEPSAKQMETIMTQAQLNKIHTIFVQPQFSQQSALAIARQLHAKIRVADDLAYDWPANLLSFARNIIAQ